MRQEELRQLSREIINGDEKEILSTLTEEDKARLLDTLKEREAELLNNIYKADLEIKALRDEIAYTEKKLSRLKGYNPVDLIEDIPHNPEFRLTGADMLLMSVRVKSCERNRSTCLHPNQEGAFFRAENEGMRRVRCQPEEAPRICGRYPIQTLYQKYCRDNPAKSDILRHIFYF